MADESVAGSDASAGRGFGLSRPVRVALGGLLAFLAAAMVGNAPYPLLGYGLVGFAIYALAFTMEPVEALAVLAVGNLLGTALLVVTQSIFTFVAAGSIVARPVELWLLQRTRSRYGDVGAALFATVVVTIVALAIGIWTYGGSGTQSAFVLLEVLFLPPALLLARIQGSNLELGSRRLAGVAVVLGVLSVVAGASTFLLPLAVAVGLLLLLAAWWVARRGLPGSWRPTGGSAWAGSAVLVVVVLLALAASGPALGQVARASLYPLYPDSLATSQWQQTDHGAACRQGNVARGGTETTGTWSPERLRVLDTCVTASGTIVALTPTSGPAVDGDYGIDLAPDPGSARFVSLGGHVLEEGHLHVEVVPVDQAPVLGNLSLHPGDHIRVTGAWVLDTDHGWGGEIHPAWSVQVLGNG